MVTGGCHAPGLAKNGKGLACQFYQWVRLAVDKLNVVVRFITLDEIGFENQGLVLVARSDKAEECRVRDHGAGLGVQVVSEVRFHPLPQVLRLTDVNDVVCRVPYDVNSRLSREFSQRFLLEW